MTGGLAMNIASMALLADTWDTNGHMGGGWWIVMILGMAVFWVAVVLGIVWLARGGSFATSARPRRETPIEILDRRFAEGAITADDYRERREVIAGGTGTRRRGASDPTQGEGASS
jgi:putative membrane protein